eukprot:TRINITY_DN3066_c0_g1_i1.p2 TRINITY_DN3066_c0_g1~~TRINITY_DN3066_c0_g1_i1.p2  ORF type:complete len:125 (+),score=6.45 TRINITY_DN3066_c0_g1_i1:148-522(+)
MFSFAVALTSSCMSLIAIVERKWELLGILLSGSLVAAYIMSDMGTQRLQRTWREILQRLDRLHLVSIFLFIVHAFAAYQLISRPIWRYVKRFQRRCIQELTATRVEESRAALLQDQFVGSMLSR